LAEDNETNQIVCAEMIKENGGTCIIAQNGVEALEALDSHVEIDIVLMDCQMPKMNGYEAAQRVRAKGCKIPILALTANATQENKKICHEAGMNGFMAKPISQFDLISKVQALLDLSTKPTKPYDLSAQVSPDIRNKVYASYLKTLDDFKLSIAKEQLSLIELNKLGHKIKSSSKMVSEFAFSELCQRLEDATSEADARGVLSEIRSMIPQVISRISQGSHLRSLV